MKKSISVLISICLLLSMLASLWFTASATESPAVWDGTTATAFAGGTGTAEDPYQIADGAQLALMREKVNDGTGNTAYYKLIANIVLNTDITNPTNTSTPIGVSNPFNGSFDGDGKTISGLYIKYADADGCGMFAMVHDATIKNFALLNSYIESTATSNDCGETGGLIAFVKDTEKGTLIDSVFVQATVKGFNKDVGGFIGLCSGSSTQAVTIQNSVFAGSVTALNSNAAGFIANGNGRAMHLLNCLNVGSIKVTSQYAAGFIGRNSGVDVWSIHNCINLGSISADNTARQLAIGSSTKENQKNTILDCYYLNGMKYNGESLVDPQRGAPASDTIQGKDMDFFMGDTEITWAGWTERANDVIIPTGVASFAPAIFARKYTVTWMSGDTVLATEEYDAGEIPEYKGETPTKAEDDTFAYLFNGSWSPAIAPVTIDTTYQAEFYQRKKKAPAQDETKEEDKNKEEKPTPQPEPAPAEKSGGCGSMIGGGAIAMIAVFGGVLAVGKKKKEDEV